MISFRLELSPLARGACLEKCVCVLNVLLLLTLTNTIRAEFVDTTFEDLSTRASVGGLNRTGDAVARRQHSTVTFIDISRYPSPLPVAYSSCSRLGLELGLGG
jgi:hypothetical protein